MYVRTAALIAIALGSSPAGLAAFTPEDYLAWLADNQVAEPQFVDGDTITYERADLVRPFIPAEYQNELIFPGMDMRIRDAGDLSPAASYIDATQRHEGTTSIDADGAIRGYVAGRPFDPETLRAGRKEDGYKLAWNWNYRWFGGALKINEVHWVWVRRGGSHGAHESISGDYRQYYLGGGTFERVLTGPYLRVYFSHRADLPDSDYRVPGAFASNTEFREYTGFTSPFDISGTAFLILRATTIRARPTIHGHTYPVFAGSAGYRSRSSQTACSAPTIRWRTLRASQAASWNRIGNTSAPRGSWRWRARAIRTPSTTVRMGWPRWTTGRCGRSMSCA
jgi:hypothetical protein